MLCRIIITVLIALSCLFTFTACGINNESPNAIFKFNEGDIVQSVTSNAIGQVIYKWWSRWEEAPRYNVRFCMGGKRLNGSLLSGATKSESMELVIIYRMNEWELKPYEYSRD